MWFLALELWPYLIGALAIGLVTGWLGGCGTRGSAADKEAHAGEGGQ